MTDIKPQKIYAIFGKYGPHTNMRKFSLEPFEGACEYVLSSTPESRDKAMDELVKYDQEIGRYDEPL